MSFSDLVLDFLREQPDGPESFVFAAGAAEALEVILDVLFTSGEDPSSGLDDLLRLGCVLEVELRSPAAAATLRAAISADPRALAVLRRGGQDEASEAHARTAERWGGEVPVKLAPALAPRPSRAHEPPERTGKRRSYCVA